MLPELSQWEVYKPMGEIVQCQNYQFRMSLNNWLSHTSVYNWSSVIPFWLCLIIPFSFVLIPQQKFLSASCLRNLVRALRAAGKWSFILFFILVVVNCCVSTEVMQVTNLIKCSKWLIKSQITIALWADHNLPLLSRQHAFRGHRLVALGGRFFLAMSQQRNPNWGTAWEHRQEAHQTLIFSHREPSLHWVISV